MKNRFSPLISHGLHAMDCINAFWTGSGMVGCCCRIFIRRCICFIYFHSSIVNNIDFISLLWAFFTTTTTTESSQSPPDCRNVCVWPLEFLNVKQKYWNVRWTNFFFRCAYHVTRTECNIVSNFSDSFYVRKSLCIPSSAFVCSDPQFYCNAFSDFVFVNWPHVSTKGCAFEWVMLTVQKKRNRKSKVGRKIEIKHHKGPTRSYLCASR